tara:strand:+ start:466 stop:618 length:153 start_codon:yes stop_codon:yes gene_type:complete
VVEQVVIQVLQVKQVEVIHQMETHQQIVVVVEEDTLVVVVVEDQVDLDML